MEGVEEIKDGNCTQIQVILSTPHSIRLYRVYKTLKTLILWLSGIDNQVGRWISAKPTVLILDFEGKIEEKEAYRVKSAY